MVKKYKKNNKFSNNNKTKKTHEKNMRKKNEILLIRAWQ